MADNTPGTISGVTLNANNGFYMSEAELWELFEVADPEDAEATARITTKGGDHWIPIKRRSVNDG